MAQEQSARRRHDLSSEATDQEMYITYDLAQRTRGGGTAIYPKVKRVYIPGDIVEWAVGRFRKRSGRVVYGVKITYQVRDESAQRAGPNGRTLVDARSSARPGPAARRYTQVIDLPDAARSVQLLEARRPGRSPGSIRSIR